MGAESYTHRDLAQALGVSETTIKSYRSKFPTFLPVAREGKPVRLHPEALDVCLRIRDLFAQGLSILQTSQALSAEFKEYPLNRRLSIAQNKPAAAASHTAAPAQNSALAEGLAARLAELAQAQDHARQRMEQLEAEVRNLATLEAASKALVAELLAELRAAKAQQPPVAPFVSAPASRTEAPSAPPVETPGLQKPAAPPAEPATQPEDTVLTARKIVTVHGPDGPLASYALGREPKPTPPFPDPQTPEAAFLDLPAVIRSDRGDFLGLPGGQSVRRLVDVLSPEGAPPASWFQESPEAWTCAIPLGRAQNREILFERTTTPRGNLVGHIRRMRINEIEATPVQLQEIFRQLRDQMA